MNEREMNELARNIIEMLKAEISSAEEEAVPLKLYVIFGRKWSNLHYVMFDELKQLKEYDRIAVVPEKWKNGKEIESVMTFSDWEKIVTQEEAFTELPEKSQFVSVFPKADRELITKTALGIDDIFAAKWIRKAMEKGQRIAILKGGLDRFTGKEPMAYKKTVLEYHRTLLEYEIELLESVMELSEERRGSGDE